jgi:hypothetical protein
MHPIKVSYQYNDKRVRQYDLFSAELTMALPRDCKPHWQEVLAAADGLIKKYDCVQLHLPWQMPLPLNIPAICLTELSIDFAIAEKHGCITGIAAAILTAAEKLREEGKFPIGNFAEFSFDEASMWLPERSAAFIAYEGGQLALNLSTPTCIESARRECLGTINTVHHMIRQMLAIPAIPDEIESVLMHSGKYVFSSGTHIQLQNPSIHFNHRSDSAFYAGTPSGDIVEQLADILSTKKATTAYVLGYFEDDRFLLRPLFRKDFESILLAFGAKQLAAVSVWEVRLSDPTKSLSSH